MSKRLLHRDTEQLLCDAGLRLLPCGDPHPGRCVLSPQRARQAEIFNQYSPMPGSTGSVEFYAARTCEYTLGVLLSWAAQACFPWCASGVHRCWCTLCLSCTLACCVQCRPGLPPLGRPPRCTGAGGRMPVLHCRTCTGAAEGAGRYAL